MPQGRLFFAAALFFLTACDSGQAGTTQAVAAASATAPSHAHAAPTRRAIPTPSGGRVIESIFQVRGDGSSSYAVPNGWATYWFGHAYKVASTEYFTGFIYVGPTGDEEGASAPGERAVLMQSTFKLANGAWQPESSQRDLGDIGARGRADRVDESRAVKVFERGQGRFLLAVPTDAQMEQGVVQKNFEILSRETEGNWMYFGNVPAGQDDSAGCDNGRVFRCNPSTGTLAIMGTDDMPGIQVVLDHGGSRETLNYYFDAETSTYRTH